MSRRCLDPWLMGGAAVLIAFFSGLGVWQLERAEQKRELKEIYLKRSKLNPLGPKDLVLGGSAALVAWRRVRVHGRYDPSVTVLLDNQILHGIPGYFVLTPFRVQLRGHWVLVNRGWIPLQGDRQRVPQIVTEKKETEITGLARPLYHPAIMLGEDEPERLSATVWRVLSVDPERLAHNVKHRLFPFVIELEPAGSSGFKREWQIPGTGEERHIAYAVQWFAFAAVVLALWLRACANRREEQGDIPQ
ncbi:MAG: SURF1 family protein [Gammaproteobacteria bacterium]